MGLLDGFMQKGRWLKMDAELTRVGKALLALPEPIRLQLGGEVQKAERAWEAPQMQQIMKNPESLRLNTEAARDMALRSIAADQPRGFNEAVLKSVAQWLVAVRIETADLSYAPFQAMHRQVQKILREATVQYIAAQSR